MPGDNQSLTVPEKRGNLHSCEPFKVTRKEASMNNVNSLSHSKWECKYHVVWIPKCRRKALYGHLRVHLGEVFRDLARQKESKVLEGHLQADHVHMLLAIPPKYAVVQVIGYIKGKSAIHIACTYRFERFINQSHRFYRWIFTAPNRSFLCKT